MAFSLFISSVVVNTLRKTSDICALPANFFSFGEKTCLKPMFDFLIHIADVLKCKGSKNF
jgi:hypothetical protein